jgi:hypothetical protein
LAAERSLKVRRALPSLLEEYETSLLTPERQRQQQQHTGTIHVEAMHLKHMSNGTFSYAFTKLQRRR